MDQLTQFVSKNYLYGVGFSLVANSFAAGYYKGSRVESVENIKAGSEEASDDKLVENIIAVAVLAFTWPLTLPIQVITSFISLGKYVGLRYRLRD